MTRAVSRGPVQAYSAILIVEGAAAKHGRASPKGAAAAKGGIPPLAAALGIKDPAGAGN